MEKVETIGIFNTFAYFKVLASLARTSKLFAKYNYQFEGWFCVLDEPLYGNFEPFVGICEHLYKIGFIEIGDREEEGLDVWNCDPFIRFKVFK